MNQPTKHYAGEMTVCDACGEPIIFLAHESTGKLAPITIATYPNGNCHEMNGNTYRALGPDAAERFRAAEQRLRLNHFSNCPNAGRFKRSNGT